MEPTITSAPPVAHEGIDAKMGAKKTETKNMKPTTTAVIPVLPPSTKFGFSAISRGDVEIKRTADTGGALNVRSNRANTHEGTHADGERVYAVSDRRTFEI